MALRRRKPTTDNKVDLVEKEKKHVVLKKKQRAAIRLLNIEMKKWLSEGKSLPRPDRRSYKAIARKYNRKIGKRFNKDLNEMEDIIEVVTEFEESWDEMLNRVPSLKRAWGRLPSNEVKLDETDYTNGRDANGNKVENGKGFILKAGDVEYKEGYHRHA